MRLAIQIGLELYVQSGLNIYLDSIISISLYMTIINIRINCKNFYNSKK